MTPGTHTILTPDLLTLDDVSRILRLSPKTLKRLGRDAGLPLFRIVPNGPLYARGSQLDTWISKRAIPQNGKAKQKEKGRLGDAVA